MHQADFLTVPLSSRRAAGVLGNEFKKMGLKTEQIDHTTYSECPVADPRNFHMVRLCYSVTACDDTHMHADQRWFPNQLKTHQLAVAVS